MEFGNLNTNTITGTSDTNINNFSAKVKILTLNDKEEWTAYLNKLPSDLQDVYYTPEYYQIYEENGDGRAICFVYERRNDCAIYPFLLNRINDLGFDLEADFYDIQGAYGYNGVLTSTYKLDFILDFYFEFKRYCLHNNIIVEFTRFHPILNNSNFSIGFLNVLFNRETVFVSLSKDYMSVYKDYTRTVKQNIRKAVANGLKIHISEKHFPYKNDFINMYRETMDRVNAEKYLYFNETYFNNTFNLPGLVHFTVLQNDLPVGSALCLISGGLLHIHFMALKTEFLNLKSSTILVDSIINFGIENGLKELHIGGGRTSSHEDSLLRFKKSFAKTTEPFMIGYKIYNEAIYNRIINQWEIKFPGLAESYKSRILRYRHTT